MQALARLSRFVGNTFTIWVLLFAVLALFAPGASAMFWSIVQVVVLPIAFGVLTQSLLREKVTAAVAVLPLVSVVAIVAIVAAVVAGNQARIASSGLMIFAVVVLHNGLGVALATAHFSPLAAVPSAIFSVWHNISGLLVATLFQRFKNEETPAALPVSVKA